MPAPSSVTASGPVVSPSIASPLGGAGTAPTAQRVTGPADATAGPTAGPAAGPAGSGKACLAGPSPTGVPRAYCSAISRSVRSVANAAMSPGMSPTRSRTVDRISTFLIESIPRSVSSSMSRLSMSAG